MNVIYIHGVSERTNTPAFDRILVQRRKLFQHYVASKLRREIVSFDIASWGELVPRVPFRTRDGQTLAHEPTSATADDPVRWQDFLCPRVSS